MKKIFKSSFAHGDQYYMIHSRQQGLYITPGYVESVEFDTLGNIHYNAKEGAIYPAFYENNIDGLVFADEKKAFDILDELVGHKTSRELGKSYDSATARRKYCERRIKF